MTNAGSPRSTICPALTILEVTVPPIGAIIRVLAMVASRRRIEALAVSIRACVISTSRAAASRSNAGITFRQTDEPFAPR